MLALNLSKIRTAHEHFEHVYQPAALPGAEDYRVVSPVTLAFDIYKDKQHFRLVGRIQATLELQCSRCLEPFTWPVDGEFDLRYQPHAENTGEGERAVEEDDLQTAFYEDDKIDLGQLMQEQFYLALPMKPLHAADCQGLCPICGTNLNRETCTCDRHWDDPRLAALKGLRSTHRES